MPGSSAKKVTFNTLTGGVGKIAVTLLGLMIFAILARHLEPADFGKYRTILTYLALTGALANFGTNVLALRDISREDADASSIIGNALALRAALSLSVLLLGVVISPFLGFDGTVTQGLLVGAIGWTALMVNDVLLAVFQSRFKQHLATMAEVAGIALNCGLVAAFAGLGGGTVAMIGAMSFGRICILLIAWRNAGRLVKLRARCDWPILRDFLVAGWPIGCSLVLAVMVMRGDTMILALLQPPEDVGQYGVAAKMFEVAVALVTVFAGLVMPLLSRQAGIRADFEGTLSESLRAAAFAGGLIAAILIAFAEPIVMLFVGRQYGPAVPTVRILALGIVIVYPLTVIRFALTALGLQAQMLRADAVGFAVAIPAYLILISKLSHQGAAIGSVLAYTATLLAAFHLLRAKAGVAIAGFVVWQPLLASGASLAMLLALGALGWPWLLCLALVGPVYFALVLLMTRPGVVSAVLDRSG